MAPMKGEGQHAGDRKALPAYPMPPFPRTAAPFLGMPSCNIFPTDSNLSTKMDKAINHISPDPRVADAEIQRKLESTQWIVDQMVKIAARYWMPSYLVTESGIMVGPGKWANREAEELFDTLSDYLEKYRR